MSIRLQTLSNLLSAKVTLLFIIFAAGIALATVIIPRHKISFEGLNSQNPLIVDRENGEVRVLALLQPENFIRGDMPRYHALVSRRGRVSSDALLKSFADDLSLFQALVKIGAVPGNNLTVDTWEERYNENSAAPDMRIDGTPIEILVYWEGLEKPISLEKLFYDPQGKSLDLRFGGNQSLIPLWRSGCIVCLYSCPGSKVGNHAYTVRDYVKNTTSFSLKYDYLPQKKETLVMVIFRIKGEK